VIALRGGKVMRGVCCVMVWEDADDDVEAVTNEDEGGPLADDGSEYWGAAPRCDC
jgi:hypothetical protein